MIRSRNMALKTGKDFIPIAEFSGILHDGVSEGNGAPTLTAHSVAASELVALPIAAAGDEVYHFYKLPFDVDRNFPIRFSIVFTHASTDADTPDWLLSLKGIAPGEALSDAASSPDEALAFAATAVSTTANALEALDFNAADNKSWLAAADRAILMALECNGLGGASANEIEVIGLEVEYTIEATSDENKRQTTDTAPVAP